MRSKIIIVLLGISVMATGGCTLEDTKLDVKNPVGLKVGMTHTELTEILGKPDKKWKEKPTIALNDSVENWTYLKFYVDEPVEVSGYYYVILLLVDDKLQDFVFDKKNKSEEAK